VSSTSNRPRLVAWAGAAAVVVGLGAVTLTALAAERAGLPAPCPSDSASPYPSDWTYPAEAPYPSDSASPPEAPYPSDSASPPEAPYPSDSASPPEAPCPSDSADPSESGAPTGGPSSGVDDAILRGERQVTIRPNPSFESILAVNRNGRLNLTDGPTRRGLFVLTPIGEDKFLIKTAKADASGEPSCMTTKRNGSAPITIVAAPCDVSREAQRWFVSAQEEHGSEGGPTYRIGNRGGLFWQVSSRNGLIAEEPEDQPEPTTFSFVDNGPSTLPALD
jgi:hypothetical protein